MVAEAKIRLSAEDRASEVLRQLRGNVGGLARQFEGLTSAVSTLAGAAAIGGLLAIAKSTIETIAAMKDLGQEASTTAEGISRFEPISRTSGVSLQDLAGSMFKVSQSLIAARDPASSAALALSSIGLTADKLKGMRVDQQFEAIARAVDKFSDSVEKNNVVKELFGKSGAQTNKAIKDIAESTSLAATVTQDEAEKADRLTDSMALLNLQFEQGRRALLMQFVPALTEIIEKMRDGAKDGGTLEAALRGVWAVFDLIKGTGPAAELEKVNTKIHELRTSIDMLEGKSMWSFLSFGLSKDAEGYLAQIKTLEGTREQLQHQVSQLAIEEQNKRALADLAERTKPTIHAQNAAQDAAYREVMKRIVERIALDTQQLQLGRQLTDVEKLTAKVHEDEASKLLKLNAEQKKNIEGALAKAKIAEDNVRLHNNEIFANAQLADGEKALLEIQQKAIDIASQYDIAAREQLQTAQFDLSMIGLSADAVAKLTAMRQIDLDVRRQIAALPNDEGDPLFALANQASVTRIMAAGENLKKNLGTIMDTSAALRDQVPIWNGLGDAAGQFFSDIVLDGNNAFDNLKRSLKSFVGELLALFAKRYVLSMIADVTGSGSAANAAASAGANTVAGSVLNYGSTYIGAALGSAGIGTVGGFFGAASGAIPSAAIGAGAVEAGVGVDSLATTIGAAIPVWGWIAVALVALAAAFKDKGENWKGQVGFGPNASAYASQGAFGPQGFSQLAGTDAQNRAIQSFLDSISSKLDGAITAHLTAAQTATITTNLAGLNTREFAFPGGDQTAAEQLALDFLKDKYSTVFDQIDKGFADFIRGFTGSSSDLVAQISAFVSFMDQLGKVGLKGLNLDAIHAFAQSGEAIGDTLNRILAAQTNFVDSFTSDAEKLANAQDLVKSTFDALGIAVPENDKAYRDLVTGIDLSTAAGRSMWSTLLQIAPAFQQVGQAAAAMAASFRQTLAQLFPAYGATASQNAILTAIEQLRQMVPAIANLGSASQILSGLVNVDATSLQAVYDMLASNPAAQALYAQIIQMYAAMQTATTGTTGLTTGITDLGGAAASTTSQLQSAQDALKSYMNSLLLNPDLSPLSPQERLAQAQQQYQSTLALAQGGDLTAVQALSGSADAYLTIARQIFASSAAYNAIFQSVFGQLGSVAGPGAPTFEQSFAAVLPPAGATLASSADVQHSADRIEAAVHTLILAIGNGVPVNDPQNAQMLEDLRVEVRKTNGQALA